MGHYRSEMGFEGIDKEKEKNRKRMRKNMAQKIKAAIKKEGIEFVLADILDNPTMAAIRFR